MSPVAIQRVPPPGRGARDHCTRRGLPVLVHGTAHAYLKVSEGCSNPCTFCAIPQMRGKFRSRSLDSLVREAAALEAQGVKELCLVAQDTTRYGEDIGIGNGLTKLVETLG